MPQPTPRRRSPRMDIVRSMLASRDHRSQGSAASKRHSSADAAAADRRRVWRERLAQYVREPDRR